MMQRRQTRTGPEGRRRRTRVGVGVALASALGVLAIAAEARAQDSSTIADRPGPFGARTLSLEFDNANGTYTATVRFPDSDREAPYPSVVYSPGLGAVKEFNAEVGAHLATHGYVVLTFTPPNTSDVGQKIDGLRDGLETLAREGADPSSPLSGLVDPQRRVVMGHSQGGEAALQFAARDPDLTAVVAEAPSIGFFAEGPIDTITAPTQVQAATLDGLVPFQNAVTNYEMQLVRPKQLVVIQGGNHVGFNDEGSLAQTAALALGLDRPAQISPAEQRMLIRRYETAWLEFHTKDREQFRTLIDGEQVRADRDADRLQDARSEL